jgi:transcriptional regulator with XRE-family HTH domain
MPPTTDLPVMRAIGRNLAEIRHHRGLTQEQLADRIGLPVDAIAKLERGAHFPRFRTILVLSRDLNVPLRDLMDDQGSLADTNNDRARLEVQGRALLHDLNDEILEIAVEQLSALARLDRPSGPKD